MRHFLRHEPSCGIGGATDKRGAFARRAAAPNGGNAVNITEDDRKYAAEKLEAAKAKAKERAKNNAAKKTVAKKNKR